MSEQLQQRAQALLDRLLPEGMPYKLDLLTERYITQYAENGRLEARYAVVKMVRHLVNQNEKSAANVKKPYDEQAFYRETASILEAICQETEQSIPPNELPVPVGCRDYIKACVIGAPIGAVWGALFGWSANELEGLLVGIGIGLLVGAFFGGVAAMLAEESGSGLRQVGKGAGLGLIFFVVPTVFCGVIRAVFVGDWTEVLLAIAIASTLGLLMGSIGGAFSRR